MTKKNAKWDITIKVDTNDADYVQDTNAITEAELQEIMPIIEALKKFKPYTVQMPGKSEWRHDNNFPIGGLPTR